MKYVSILLLILLSYHSLADEAPSNQQLQDHINVMWTCLAAFLVFFMQAGFALVEIGLTRAKNAINIIMKNLMDFSVATAIFFFFGFGLMFGKSNGFFGTTDFLLAGVEGEHWNYTFMLFQTVFAGTAATIVSGSMAERTKFSSYLIYSFFITAIIYPIFVSWAWGSLLNGSGWLENLKTGAFTDFAGSTVVHSIGGWLALAGAMILGPRKGKYAEDGTPRAIPGHNIPFAAIGVFILWFGWFGFNAGSTTSGDMSIGRIAFVTNISAAMGAIGAMVASWLKFSRPDASMSLNGALAGLVGITAGCNTLTPFGALVVGLVCGVVVVYSVVFIERVLKVDDPVGAVSVHGVCGALGTIACGLLNAEGVINPGNTSTGLLYGGGMAQLGSQFIGVIAAFVWSFGLGFILFSLVKKVFGLRVEEEEEYVGLDIQEHGMEAYFESR